MIQNVRERGVRHWRRVIDGTMRGRTAEHVRELLTGAPGCSEVMAEMVPLVVDQVLHDLLASLQETDEVALVVQSEGRQVNPRDVSDGLAGELYGDAGWIARFGRVG